MHLKTCHEILVLELIGDCCNWQRVGSVHYQFKLPVQLYLEIFIPERKTTYMHSTKYKRIDIPWLCRNLTDGVFYTGMKNDCFLSRIIYYDNTKTIY